MRLIDADALREEWLRANGEFSPNDILDSIDNQPTQPVWINASEKSPDERGGYLVYVEWDLDMPGLEPFIDKRLYLGDWFKDYGERITWWMPLPQKPKGGKQ